MKKITITEKDAAARRLSPAAIGNGDLSLVIDHEGMQRQKEPGYGIINPGIRRAGYRYNTMRGELIPFGYFLTGDGEPKEIRSFTQSIDPGNGLVENECIYTDGTFVAGSSFCCLHRNILIIRRKSSEPLTFRYMYAPENAAVEWKKSGEIRFQVKGIKDFSGVIYFRFDVETEMKPIPGGFCWEIPGREFNLVIGYDDEVQAADADRLFYESYQAWAAYHSEGFVALPDERLQQIYDLSQYHLRISSTAYGMPTGIYDSHWHGRYFAFDEHFTFQGLITSGHVSTALKIPDFRSSIYRFARKRIEGDAKEWSETGVILYPWETNEIGEENSPRGFWYDHVFQIASLVLNAYDAYRYTGDLKSLRERWYPVLVGSVEYLRKFHIIPGVDGTSEIGCCTDLERLGPMRYNPFMTACSAIAALEAAAVCASLLNIHDKYIPVWQKTARELRKNLPRCKERYIAYKNCTEDVHTIGQLAGIYPYKVLTMSDVLQAGAFRDYTSRRNVYGNMYENASGGICSWYLNWESLAESCIGNGERAWEILNELGDSTGCFGELFELYANGFRPWFTTAEGEMVHAVNNMLLQIAADGTAHVAPAIPAKWSEFAFKLQGYNGQKIEVESRKGTIKTNIIKGE